MLSAGPAFFAGEVAKGGPRRRGPFGIPFVTKSCGHGPLPVKLDLSCTAQCTWMCWVCDELSTGRRSGVCFVRREMALELACGTDVEGKVLCGAGPSDVGVWLALGSRHCSKPLRTGMRLLDREFTRSHRRGVLAPPEALPKPPIRLPHPLGCPG